MHEIARTDIVFILDFLSHFESLVLTTEYTSKMYRFGVKFSSI